MNFPHFEPGRLTCSTKMKMLLFTVLLVPVLLAVSIDSDGENFIDVKVGPGVKYYDSDGGQIMVPSRNKHDRFIRRASTCKFPPKMVDSQLDCRLYPSNVLCNQTCMFGHTLSEGIQRQMRCNYKEDKWLPVPTFEKCKPFVDCTLTLGPGGKYKCYTNFMDKGPTCEVSCAHYEDIPAVPQAEYKCDIRGNWTPKLPFCATSGSGVKLVAPPKGLKIGPGY